MGGRSAIEDLASSVRCVGRQCRRRFYFVEMTHQTALPLFVARVPQRSASRATICKPRPCSSSAVGRSCRGSEVAPSRT